MSTNAPDAYTIGILTDLRMDASVELYMTGGKDVMKGRGYLGWLSMNILDAFTNNIWKITIKSAAGKTGTLTLPRSAKITSKEIDLRETDVGDPMLFPEYSFSGVVGSGTGVFKCGIVRPTK